MKTSETTSGNFHKSGDGTGSASWSTVKGSY